MSYEAWRISFQSSEQAARFAYKNMEEWQTRLAWAIEVVEKICAVEEGDDWGEALSTEVDEVIAWKYQLPNW